MGAIACGAPAEGPAPDTFIALQKDFAGFESWQSVSWTDDATNATHEPGTHSTYLNKRPEHGSAEYPVGTILVKSSLPAGGGEEQLFAMAKRGGGFNQSGATDWEWFELARSTTGVPVIVWRGVGAPAGHRYSEVDASCNECHRSAEANDFVKSQRLLLQSF
jgi:hypothetical protein